MASITIFFESGHVREFPHEGRAGGSYTKKVSYEGEFVVVTDEYSRTFVFPASQIKEVRTTPTRF